MAWGVNGYNLTMTVEDFGVELPFTFEFEDVTLGANDSMMFVFKKSVGGENLIVKEFDGIVDNKVNLVFTAQDSTLLPVGTYVYRLDWYQSGSFMDNLIPCASFKVVRKA